MMLFALLKKDFLIVKKYVLIMLVVIALIPPVMRWRTPEFYGSFWIYSFCHFLAFSAVAICIPKKSINFQKLRHYYVPHHFHGKAIVSSKYIFCMAIYAICCIVFELETLFMPGLGTSDIKLFAFMFLIVSVFIGIYLPIQYKFGYEKTKFAFGVIIMASPFILPLLMRAGNLNLNFLSMFSPYLVYGGIVLIGFATLAISASLSIKIYDKADLA